MDWSLVLSLFGLESDHNLPPPPSTLIGFLIESFEIGPAKREEQSPIASIIIVETMGVSY